MSLTHYRRNLPHILPPNETVFVTFRLAGSVPVAALEQWRSEQSKTGQQPTYGQTDTWLDSKAPAVGPDWLRLPQLANVVGEALHFRHPKDYTLWAYCVMPNHVHFVATIANETVGFVHTLQSLKARTARRCNALLARSGPFWQDESYDHVVRRSGEEMQRVISYILHNPVKAGLVADWQQWPFSYLNPEW
ncbi:hypothetical protein D3Y59_01595 [Hymenobacter oligotrophus]|uniref:Transposase IS200-like domain-containing protein n=1 Tax=Hymenobacter oligotrophus TaxID=2319843 RepID=A0A3B7QVN3_9BACT|nr:transposase [Hymenobacter oligotrophus]AYA35854.1 hypothetical protein D3Y59_01595 [Hymenobacter oligotrophus]